MLAEMETNNGDMSNLVSELIQDKKSAANQKQFQDDISTLLTENQGNQNLIKEKLAIMTEDIADSRSNFRTSQRRV